MFPKGRRGGRRIGKLLPTSSYKPQFHQLGSHGLFDLLLFSSPGLLEKQDFWPRDDAGIPASKTSARMLIKHGQPFEKFLWNFAFDLCNVNGYDGDTKTKSFGELPPPPPFSNFLLN